MYVCIKDTMYHNLTLKTEGNNAASNHLCFDTVVKDFVRLTVKHEMPDVVNIWLRRTIYTSKSIGE